MIISPIAQSSACRALASLAAAVVVVAVVATGSAAQNSDVAGVWIDDSGKGAIEIAPCDGDKLCGRIVWLKQPNDKSGKPLTDGYNPKMNLRQQPVCGLQVMGDLQRVSGGTWDNGWIYDPKQGKQFDVEIKLRAPDRLQVMGYQGVKFLSETFVWTRAPATIARCDTASSQATIR